MHLDLLGIAGSSGSACSTGNPKPSHTLLAMGFEEAWALGGLRLTIGRDNTTEEIDYVVSSLPDALQKLRMFTAFYT